MKHILAISGSTRQQSTNSSLINAITELYKDNLAIQLSDNIANLPHFNPDFDNGNSPEAVTTFRARLKEADGILICTPEYAMGVPGTLKNAIDWTVSSMEFSGKPTALITAGLSGIKGHHALMETLQIIEADIPKSSQLIISFAKTKVKEDVITDADTLQQVKAVMNSLIERIIQKQNQ